MKKHFRLPILAHLSAPLPVVPASSPASSPARSAKGPGWWGFYWRLSALPGRSALAGVALAVAGALAVVPEAAAQPGSAVATAATQTLRGVITDAQSGLGLPGATVRAVLADGTAPRGTVTAPDGSFRLPGVPLGRQTIRVSMVGYADLTVPNVIVTAGKEAVLNVRLQESLTQLGVATVVGERVSRNPSSAMATVSARTFDVETTNRFAGSRADPARMAQNFAGVSGANDSRNDIIVRGNSPTGLLWRLEGMNIPNPNHYGTVVSTGGPVSILNNNVLDKSDFLTAAFPAQYGNALAGVFDLQLRPGNNQQREYLAQVGFNGFEVGMEGPFGKVSSSEFRVSSDEGVSSSEFRVSSSDTSTSGAAAPNPQLETQNSKLNTPPTHGAASYLANYRYSTLGVFKQLGVNFGTGAATPEYQDLTFKIDAPTDHGRWTVWGIGGMSRINLLGSAADTTETDLYGDDDYDQRVRFRTGVGGASYTHYFGDKTFARLTVAQSATEQQFTNDSLSTQDRHPVPVDRARFVVRRSSAHALVSHKFSARDNAVAGVILDLYGYSLSSERLVPGRQVGTVEASGQSLLTQGYAQWQHRFSEQVSATAGATVLHFALNNAVSVEPRAGLKWQVGPSQSLNAGVGLHSQMQPILTYFFQTHDADGTVRETNRNLDFTRATHYVLGYDQQLSENLRLRVETYYQELRRAPVEQRPSSFSMLTSGADFNTADNDSLVSRGRGRNLGAELTLERTFTGGYYFLLTASVFDSKYQGSDGVWRNTPFNGHYVTNLLAGREWKMGAGGRNVLSLDLKLTANGGRFTTPIDAAASQAAGETRYLTEQAYTRQVKDYFRTDIKVGFRMNRARLTHELALDVQNVTNRQNVFAERYNPRTGRYATEYQLGLFPIPLYRLTF